MSESRKVHPGLFRVVIGLAIPWYIGLGIGFTFFTGTKLTSATTYDLVSKHIPLQFWGGSYLMLGTAMCIATLVPKIPHFYVKLLSGIGLVMTTTWIATFIFSIFLDKLDTISVLPAWTMIAMVEWAALNEPYRGPGS